MKKILIITIFALLLIGCTKYGKCQVNYDVIYPDTTITYDSIFNYRYTELKVYKSDPHIPIPNSWKGSNYIKLGDDDFAATTCPIRVNSYKSILIENE